MNNSKKTNQTEEDRIKKMDKIISDLEKKQKELDAKLQDINAKVDAISPTSEENEEFYYNEFNMPESERYGTMHFTDNSDEEEEINEEPPEEINSEEEESSQEQESEQESIKEEARPKGPNIEKEEDEEDNDDNNGCEKPLWQHFEDLRHTIMKCVGGVILCTFFGLFASPYLQVIFRLPVENANRPEYDFDISTTANNIGSAIVEYAQEINITILNSAKIIQINNDGVSSAFLTTLKVGFIFGLVISLPFLIYFIWQFISPGLSPKERKMVENVGWAGGGLFLLGMVFGYGVIYFGVPILASFAQEGTVNIWRYMDYISFCAMLMTAFGIIFELPIFLIGMVRFGLITTAQLTKFRPYAIVLIFITAALLTPPDPASQLSMGVPLCLLYQISIWIGKYYEKQEKENL